MIDNRPLEVVTALEARFPTLRMKRWGEQVAGFGHTPVQAEGKLGERPFYFRYRHDHACLAVWPTGTQELTYSAVHPGDPIFKVFRDDVLGDPYSGDLTADQMIEVLGALLIDALEQLPDGEDELLTTRIVLPRRITTIDEAQVVANPFEPAPDEIYALTHPHLPALDAVRAVVLDCTGVEEFTADAIGHLAERLALHLNAFTLEGATEELTEAFTEQSIEKANFERIFAMLNPQIVAGDHQDVQRGIS